MARLTWNAQGERYYESGVDRGVLYVNETGVAWSGLISVEESPSGGEPNPFYIDGYKYLNLAKAEEFEATITAFSSPPEFGPCDGTASIQNGLFVTQQPRKPFDFSYRTRIGNDVDGDEHGYKIHLVYGALAGPSDRSNQTLNDSVEPLELSWEITTKPPVIPGFRPTAHFIVDTRYTAADRLFTFEEILYGGEASASRLPPVLELMEIFHTGGVDEEAGA